MKKGDLNLKVVGIFSWGINRYLLIRSNLARSCRWNSKSWAMNWTLDLAIKISPKEKSLGL